MIISEDLLHSREASDVQSTTGPLHPRQAASEKGGDRTAQGPAITAGVPLPLRDHFTLKPTFFFSIDSEVTNVLTYTTF